MKKAELKAKYQELHDYFREEMCNGRFEVEKRDKYTYTIKVDDFDFGIWVANGSSAIHTYESSMRTNAMKIIFREEDKEHLWMFIKKDMDDTFLKEEEEKEKAEFERLKEKYK